MFFQLKKGEFILQHVSTFPATQNGKKQRGDRAKELLLIYAKHY